MSLLEQTTGNLTSDHSSNVSEIRSYFRGKTIFVTGVTGFLGKLIVEKLLRTCSDVGKIFILVREKNGKNPKERIKEIFDTPVFEPLMKQTPHVTDKLTLCMGDCLKPNLGLSQRDVVLLQNEVDCVIHCAATVRFDVGLRTATYINVRTVMDLMRIAKKMTKLTSFVHISTAFSHCPRSDIEEKTYKSPMKGQKLMDLVESLNDDMLDAITPIIIKEWPNTYTFTKAVADEIVKTEGKGLPVSIFKPSIIVALSKEPIPGWIDNLYGPNGVIVAGGIGLMQTLHCDPTKRADLVPADYVVNAILASAWDMGQKNITESCESVAIHNHLDPIVYNYVSGRQNPLTWAYFLSLVMKYGYTMPPSVMVWYYSIILNRNFHVHLLCEYLLQMIPVYILDFCIICCGKDPVLVSRYKKIRKFSQVISYFATREWNFEDTNIQNLWNKLNVKDRELFEFDIKLLDWDAFFKTYVLGCRIFLMKDPIDTLAEGKRKARIFKIAHFTLLASLCFLVYTSVKLLFKIVF